MIFYDLAGASKAMKPEKFQPDRLARKKSSSTKI